MPRKLLFAFIDFSAFHGNGDVIWLADDGTSVVQRAEPGRTRLFRFTVEGKEMARIREHLGKLSADSLKVSERTLIPGEVMVRFGFKTKEGAWKGMRIPDGDWAKQSADIRTFFELSQRILKLTAGRKAVSDKTIKFEDLKMDLPEDFASEDIQAALR